MGGLAVGPRYGHGMTDVSRRLGDYTNNEGLLDFVMYHQTGAAVDAQTITIGGDKWRVDLLATSPGNTANGEWNHATGALDVTIAAHGLIAGDGIFVGSELMRATSITDVNHVHIAAKDRALGGTSLAAHADATAINLSAHKGSWSTLGQIPVFVGVLTNTVFITRLAAFINERFGLNTTKGQNYVALAPDTTSLLISAGERRRSGLSTALTVSETMTNGAFDQVSMSGGGDPARRRIAQGSRNPTAAEVTAGLFLIPHDFEANPSAVIISVIDSTGVVKAWNGVMAFHAPTVGVAAGVGVLSGERLTVPGFVSLDNSGATDWAATDTIHFLLAE